MFRIAIAPNTPGTAHSFDREEIFVVLSGEAQVTIGDETLHISGGDALIVPAGQSFSVANESSRLFEAVVALPVGGRAAFPSGESFVPPVDRMTFPDVVIGCSDATDSPHSHP